MFSHIKELFTRPSGYTIAKSVRLRSSASAYFNRTPSASSRTTWTWTAWVKRGKLGSAQALFSAGTGTAEFRLTFTSSDTIEIYEYTSPSYNWQKITTAVYRDPSAWYQIQLVYDTTNGTAGDRVKLYVNSVQVTSFGTNTNPTPSFSGYVNSAVAHGIGSFSTGSSYLDGYLTEINFIDGQALTPSSFGETDSITGVWKAKKYGGTYGTNGFYLNFSDNSSNTATTIGKDYSGNGNNWTPNNISVTSGVTYDSMVDSPTVSAVSSNYAVLNPLRTRNSPTISYANLRLDGAGASHKCAVATFELQGGVKIYAEATVLNTTAGAQPVGFGFTDVLAGATLPAPSDAGGYIFYGNANGNIYNGTTLVTSSLGAPSAGTVLQIAYNPSNGKAWVGKGNVWYNSAGSTTGDPANDANATFTLSTTLLNVLATAYDTNSLDLNFGQRPFTYTPPTGFVALNTYNLPASTITNGAAYMAATTYTGNVTARNISNAVNGVSFQPDLVWLKNRTTAYGHVLQDSIRGTSVYLASNSTAADTAASLVTAFNSDGFAVSTSNVVNENSAGIVGWQWKAGGTSSSNTNGSITSTVSAGATQGFSVVTYTGTGANATVGHGLGVAPNMVIVKDRSVVTNWAVYHSSLTSAAYVLLLNLTAAQTSASTVWNSTAPTSSVFSIGTSSATNTASENFVAYCFAAVAGYSAFGSYTGNGSTDGPFVFTGFRPRFILWKRITTSGGHWGIIDSGRNPYNLANLSLLANAADGDATNVQVVDLLSNGFKVRTSDGGINLNNDTIIYAAFAENPFKNALAR